VNVLVGCEESGIIASAFRARGHKAWSCDPAKPSSQWHFGDDVRNYIGWMRWDLFIVHPPCQWLSVSGIHWNYRGRNGLTPAQCWAKTTEAEEFFLEMAMTGTDHPASSRWINRVCIENPISIMSNRYRKPDQIIQPYEFGHDASKKTCLWLMNLPRLKPTRYIAPRMVAGKPRWANQTDSGQNRLAPSEHRAADRARTYQGIANAMAEQWSDSCLF
jgi:hypothetical protein